MEFGDQSLAVGEQLVLMGYTEDQVNQVLKKNVVNINEAIDFLAQTPIESEPQRAPVKLVLRLPNREQAYNSSVPSPEKSMEDFFGVSDSESPVKPKTTRKKSVIRINRKEVAQSQLAELPDEQRAVLQGLQVETYDVNDFEKQVQKQVTDQCIEEEAKFLAGQQDDKIRMMKRKISVCEARMKEYEAKVSDIRTNTEERNKLENEYLVEKNRLKEHIVNLKTHLVLKKKKILDDLRRKQDAVRAEDEKPATGSAVSRTRGGNHGKEPKTAPVADLHLDTLLQGPSRDQVKSKPVRLISGHDVMPLEQQPGFGPKIDPIADRVTRKNRESDQVESSGRKKLWLGKFGDGNTLSKKGTAAQTRKLHRDALYRDDFDDARFRRRLQAAKAGASPKRVQRLGREATKGRTNATSKNQLDSDEESVKKRETTGSCSRADVSIANPDTNGSQTTRLSPSPSAPCSMQHDSLEKETPPTTLELLSPSPSHLGASVVPRRRTVPRNTTCTSVTAAMDSPDVVTEDAPNSESVASRTCSGSPAAPSIECDAAREDAGVTRGASDQKETCPVGLKRKRSSRNVLSRKRQRKTLSDSDVSHVQDASSSSEFCPSQNSDTSGSSSDSSVLILDEADDDSDRDEFDEGDISGSSDHSNRGESAPGATRGKKRASTLTETSRQKGARDALQKRRTDAVPKSTVGGEDDQNSESVSAENENAMVEFEGGLRLPASLYEKLFDYQVKAVLWMWELHNQRVGGILGDEMGLGKTLECIAFLTALATMGQFEPSLIICPATVMQQWVKEFHVWAPQFRVGMLHSNLTFERKMNVISKVSSRGDILVTSYEMLKREEEELLSKRWQYVILDEGHRIRNPDAHVTLVCKRIDTPHRIILTGTPIQNDLVELWSLYDFVFPGRLGTLPVFQEQFSVPISLGGYSTATKYQVTTAHQCAVMLRDLISPYLLRRLKKDVSLALPEKNEQVLFCRMTEEQRTTYIRYLNSREVIDVITGASRSFKAIITLRKICNHPDLLFVQSKNQLEDYGDWDAAGKLRVLDQILPIWKKQGHRVLLFCQTRQMLDIIEDGVKDRGFSYRRMDGATNVTIRMAQIDEYNNDDSIFLFLLTTRVGGIGVNLTGADRILIYDPDWNPSTDMQARERAWRLGQDRDVVIYRLIMSGSIEEKVYHRQIFKNFLSDKVLKDPKQRRFFKARDLKDLFSIGDDAEGTETGDLFADVVSEATAGQPSERKTSKEKASLQRDQLLHKQLDRPENPENDEKSSSGAAAVKAVKEASGEELVHALLGQRDSLHSAISHDKIESMGARDDGGIALAEARKIANRAMRALQDSRRECMAQPVHVPTWTGRSGQSGAPRRRFGRTARVVNTEAASVSVQGGSEMTESIGETEDSSKKKPVSSSQLLQRLRERGPGNMNNSDPTDKAAQGSFEHDLAFDLHGFLVSKGGSCAAKEIVAEFKGRLGDNQSRLLVFRRLLQDMAVMRRRGKEWVLKEEFGGEPPT
eukprot:Rmarinus@m.17114